jgi:periplasmic protein TonB
VERSREFGVGMDRVRRLVRLPAGAAGRSPIAVPARRERPLGPTLTVSLALHLSLLVLLLVSIQHRPYRTEQVPPADFAMVFEGHSPELNSGPSPEPNKLLRPGSPAPGVSAPSVPPAPATPPAPVAPPQVANLPPPPPPPPAPQEPVEAHPAPAPPVPPMPPEAKLPPAAPAPTPAPAPIPAPAPTPIPLAMAIPRPPPIHAAPVPLEKAPPSRPEHRPERPPAFPAPLAFSFGVPGATSPNAATSRATAPPSAPTRVSRPGQPGTIDLSFGPIQGGSLSPSASVQMEGVAVSTDWLNLVSAWWKRHAYYPPQAGDNNEDGTVTLHMRVDRDGRVEALELTGKSGSRWLDLGALSVFRDAHLPPLPPDMPDAQIPFEATVHYIIVR